MAELANAPKAKLNLIHCYRSMNYICRHMEETYGIPWVEYNFFGPTKIYESIRRIAAHFDDSIKANAEALIEKMRPEMDAVIAEYKPLLEGKTVMLYVGGLRPRHVIGAYEDLGMEIIAAGYEFGHNDEYKRTYPLLEEGSIIVDERHPLRARGDCQAPQARPCRQWHQGEVRLPQDGRPLPPDALVGLLGPYHGFDGFKIFARDMDMTVNSPVWGLVRDVTSAECATPTGAERQAS